MVTNVIVRHYSAVYQVQLSTFVIPHWYFVNIMCNNVHQSAVACFMLTGALYSDKSDYLSE